MTASEPLDLPVTTRSKTYLRLVGVVTAMLALGLALPALVGERPPEQELSAGTDFDLDALDGGTTATTVAGEGDATATTVAGTDGAVAGGPTATVPGGDGAAVVQGPTATAPQASVPNTASDVGVTETTIKIGLLVGAIGYIAGD